MSQTAVEGHSSQGEERRTYQRYAVDLNALVTSSEERWLKCNIRDYCLGGMLVVFADEETAQQGADLRANDNVIIEFPLVVDGVIKSLSQQCRIARLVEGGFGLVFVDPDSDFIDVLREFTRITIAPKAPGERSLPPARLASKIRKAVSICQRTVNIHLPGIYREIFHRSNKALLAHASRESLGNHERNAIFDDIQLLESLWDKKESVFLGHIHKTIVKMVHKETGLLTGATGETKYQLALVDQNQFEDWLCITDLASRIQAEHRYSLFTLGQQLASLTTHSDDQMEVPVAPNVFGGAIREILEPLRVGVETQQIIFREAADVLTEKLGKFYAHLIDELRSNVVTETQDHSGAGNGFAQAGPTPRFLTEHSNDLAESKPVETAGPSTEELHDAQEELHNTHEELVNLLQQIQGNPDQMIPDSAEPQQTAESLQDGAAQDSDSTNAAPPLDASLDEQIETTGRLLEILQNEEQVSANVIPWIRSLSQPLLKTSLMDPRFFDNQRHPLRSILNQLEQLGMYIDRNDQSQVAGRIASIDNLVERVVSNPEDTEGVLGEVATQLGIIEAQCSREYSQNVEQVVLTCEALQRAAHAEQAVCDQLNVQLSQQQVPCVVTDLLQTGWLLLLERTYIREGTEGSTWKQYLFVLERLIQLLSKHQQPHSQSGQEGLELYRVVAYALQSVSFDPLRKKNLLDSLKNLLVDDSQPRDTQPDMSDFEPLHPSGKSTYYRNESASLEPPAPQGASQEAWRDALEQVQALCEGNRVEVVSQDGSTRSYRLAWIGDKNSKFVFVDPCGLKAEEFDLAGLANKIYACELTAKTETDTPLIDQLAAAMGRETEEQPTPRLS